MDALEKPKDPLHTKYLEVRTSLMGTKSRILKF